ALAVAARRERAARRGPSPRQPRRGRDIPAVAAPAVQAVRGDPEELVLARSGRGHRDQAGAKLEGLAAAGPRAVQQQAEPGPPRPVERVRVTQERLMLSSRQWSMTDYGYPEPAFLLKRSELPGEPVRLLLANPAVLVLGPVAAGQCRVQRGDRHAQVRNLEQRPGLRALDDGAVQTP